MNRFDQVRLNGRRLMALAVGSVIAAQGALASSSNAIDVTDYTSVLSENKATLLTIVGAGFVLLGIVVVVRYFRRAAK